MTIIILQSELLIKIVKQAKKSKALVLIDEAYCQFYGKTSIPLIKKYDNVIVLQTLSKAFGLAGIRLGYIISNKYNIKIMQKVLSPYSVNGIASECAIAALRDLKYVKEYVSKIKQSKKIVYAALDSLEIKYYKSGANFVLINIGEKSDYFCKELKENKILARNRSSDPLLEGCVRITIGTKRQTRELISCLRKTIKKIRSLLIFDIDGVLVDDSRSYRVAIKQTGEFFANSEVTLQEIQSYKELGRYNNDWNLTEAIIKSRGKNIEKQKIIRKFQDFYKNTMNNEKWLLNKSALKELSRKYNLAILTGRPKKEAYYVLRENNVMEFFETIVSMEDVSRQKPDPEGILKIQKQFQASDAYYFGDTIDDMKTAAFAGITPIGILPPQNKSLKLKKLLLENGAKFVLNDVNKISEALK